MSKKYEVMALILARGGSTGVPGKNFKPLAGKPLIGHTIDCAKASKYITRTVVATDSEDIAKVAREFSADVPFMRKSEMSQKLSRAYPVYQDFLKELQKREGYRPDIVVLLFSTSVTKTTEEIDASIEKLIDTGCHWVFTVTECEHHPFRFFKPIGNDRMIPYCQDVRSQDIWGNRQELPPVYRINGNAFVTWTENIENFDTYNIDTFEYFDQDIRYVLCPQETSLDIDTPLDFMIADFTMRERLGMLKMEE